VFEDADFEKTLDLIDNTTEYALTGAMSVSVLLILSFLNSFLLPHLVSQPIEKPSSQPPTACATLPETCTTMRNAQAPWSDSSPSVVRVPVGRTIKRGV